jgi:hypothetical protein
MNKLIQPKKTERSAAFRILRAVGTVFSAGWVVVAALLLLFRASWQEFVGSVLLLGGFFISWVLTLYVLKWKNPKYVEKLIEEISEEEGKRQERLVIGASNKREVN